MIRFRKQFVVVFVLVFASSGTTAWAKKPKFPAANEPAIVFIPGASSSGTHVWTGGLSWLVKLVTGDKYFGKFQKTASKLGMGSFVCPKSNDKDRRTIPERTEECVQQILESRGVSQCTDANRRDVILVGHSMGGLIARELAQDSRVSRCIHSVTTIATPHMGTPIADFAIWHVNRQDEPGVSDWWGKVSKWINFDPNKARYLHSLRVDRTGYDPAVFAAQDVIDNPQVNYYSFSASMDNIIDAAVLEVTQGIINKELVARGLDKTQFGKKNDGVVPAYSMIHGHHVAWLDAHHWGSACIDFARFSPSCRRTLKSVMPHLQSLFASAGK